MYKLYTLDGRILALVLYSLVITVCRAEQKITAAVLDGPYQPYTSEFNVILGSERLLLNHLGLEKKDLSPEENAALESFQFPQMRYEADPDGHGLEMLKELSSLGGEDSLIRSKVYALRFNKSDLTKALGLAVRAGVRTLSVSVELSDKTPHGVKLIDDLEAFVKAHREVKFVNAGGNHFEMGSSKPAPKFGSFSEDFFVRFPSFKRRWPSDIAYSREQEANVITVGTVEAIVQGEQSVYEVTNRFNPAVTDVFCSDCEWTSPAASRFAYFLSLVECVEQSKGTDASDSSKIKKAAFDLIEEATIHASFPDPSASTSGSTVNPENQKNTFKGHVFSTEKLKELSKNLLGQYPVCDQPIVVEGYEGVKRSYPPGKKINVFQDRH